jgi:alkanesulfonate monooxygenase SsuD/methylene tetrahydromethanopterin reductase-like flavin-dependent oxidoreductase (luciferase family)
MADEYMDVVNQLFASWDADAVIKDRKRGVYADYTKVRPIHFDGEFFKCRGPLNTAPSPQGRPTYVQAGGSPRGRDFAAKHADSIIATANEIDGMKAFRDDVRGRAASWAATPTTSKSFISSIPLSAKPGKTRSSSTADWSTTRTISRGRSPASARSPTSTSRPTISTNRCRG